MITANSFMKREFGKKLIEAFLPRIDLTHVIDTSGAYIPGHGTPTVILFGRHRAPMSHEVRAVLGIRGEPNTPDNPAQGLVWQSIVEHLDNGEAQNGFVSVTNVPRETFSKHPWSIGGGGQIELTDFIEQNAVGHLKDAIETICSLCITRQDESYLPPPKVLERMHIRIEHQIICVQEDQVRDWQIDSPGWALFPYDSDLNPVSFEQGPEVHRFLWPMRELLWRRRELGGDHRELGRTWWEWNRFLTHRFRTSNSIAFAFVATHNHFVFNRGRKAFKNSAPLIILASNATEVDHIALLGLLNSSTACFWMKQVLHDKGNGGIGGGIANEEWERFYEHTSTGLSKFPVPAKKPGTLSALLEQTAAQYSNFRPDAVVKHNTPTNNALVCARQQTETLLNRMIALQEELDWRCYTLYALTDQNLCYCDTTGNQLSPPAVRLGQRAFEIIMARKMAAGELETTWFERHWSTPTTELPSHWPADYRRLVERRMALIESQEYINLIERPEYKRRWNTEPWEEQERRALRHWLLDRLETTSYWPEAQLQTTRTLADRVQFDGDFMQVAELYRGHAGFDVYALVAELVEAEAVPFLPVLRYKASGLRKRDLWERTWELQRSEDATDAEVAAVLVRRLDETAEQFQARLVVEQQRRKQTDIGDIPPPPKYTAADFHNATCWRLRGPLDVPKERFISCPFCSRAHDPALVVAWAGWDHLQQAKALAAWYTELVAYEGWAVERLTPLLAGLAELLPWLKQWHNDIDPDYHERMGDFFALFLQGQLQQCGLTRDDLKRWQPPATGRARRRRIQAS